MDQPKLLQDGFGEGVGDLLCLDKPSDNDKWLPSSNVINYSKVVICLGVGGRDAVGDKKDAA